MENRSVDASLRTSGSDTAKQPQEKSKNDSRKKPGVGKTSTSDNEVEVQSCEGIISSQSTEHKKELGLYS